KGLWHVIQDQLTAIEKEVQQNNADHDFLRADVEQYQIKKKSYEILTEQTKSDEFEAEHQQTSSHFEEAAGQLRINEEEYQSLKYAREQQELKKHQELLKQSTADIEAYDQDEAIDYEEKIAEENQKLAGFYEEQIN